MNLDEPCFNTKPEVKFPKQRRRQSTGYTVNINECNRANSILIIGGSGRTGIACLRRLSIHKSKPEVHVFCQDGSKLSKEDKNISQSVIEGDAENENDLRNALKTSRAKTIIVCIGNGDSLAKTEIRSASACALVQVLRKRKFRDVRALVVSRTKNNNPLQTHKMRNILEDHIGQEDAFMMISDRVTVVRPTMLKDKRPTGSIRVLSWENEKSIIPPSNQTPRADLASWIVEEICCDIPIGGKVVNITGSRGHGRRRNSMI